MANNHWSAEIGLIPEFNEKDQLFLIFGIVGLFVKTGRDQPVDASFINIRVAN
ncbi:hypothetical protein FD12_GL000855 [Lentilactobacillus rapi DSM 19907 = JCM 15042]|uniref:Uncharacterized protein n=1 Tax=Lentilactobacillus rapi DSM 19907 = JCM 15042 TaxID=1423795 RepID=A0ABR5PAG6_9LACO|nr:hypothetical protein FD12_GL000855 [Lentilactobacillus rapi DSM 19907 = JCM 15042]